MSTFLKKDLHDIEQVAFEGQSLVHSYLADCVSEIRRLQHELNDPNYQYSGRIHRAAILCRNADIDKQREQIKKLEAKVRELEGKIPLPSTAPAY